MIRQNRTERPGVKTCLYMRINGKHYVVIFSRAVRRRFTITEETAEAVFARLAKLRLLVDENHPRAGAAPVLFVDFETFSPVDITTEGAWKYAARAGIILLSYRISSWPAGKVKFVENFSRSRLTLKDLPDEIVKWKGQIIAHNWSFEHAIFSRVLPFLKHFAKPENYICTAATARRMGLPGALYDAAKALNLKNQKDKAEGSKLIKLYSIPDKTGAFRPILADDRKKWLEYGKGDVLAMESIFNTLPRLDADAFEWPVFQLDQKINLRGLTIDRPSVTAIKGAYEKIVDKAAKEAKKLCGLEPSGVLTVTSSAGFGKWLAAQGEPVDNVQAATVAEVAGRTKNKTIKKAVELRQTLAAAGPKKLESLLTFSDAHGVMRHAFFYFGGHTGRWSGRGAQPQNFVRSVADDWQKTFYDLVNGKGGVSEVNSLLRGCIVPPSGKRFIVGDFAAIEARALFYLAGCRAGLQVFRDGRDIYKEQAARFYDVPVNRVDAKRRQIGKAQILGLGYGMGANRFIDYAATYGVELTAGEAETAVRIYRNGFPEVGAFWRASETAFKDALLQGTAVQGEGVRRIVWARSADKRFLRVRLPSDRALYYFNPRIDSEGRAVVSLPRGGVQTLWGGVIVENIVQAYCRDLLAVSMLAAEKAGLSIVGTIHDEILAEAETAKADGALIKLEKAMSTPPTWAAGFPLQSECKILERYGK